MDAACCSRVSGFLSQAVRAGLAAFAFAMPMPPPAPGPATARGDGLGQCGLTTVKSAVPAPHGPPPGDPRRRLACSFSQACAAAPTAWLSATRHHQCIPVRPLTPGPPRSRSRPAPRRLSVQPPPVPVAASPLSPRRSPVGQPASAGAVAPERPDVERRVPPLVPGEHHQGVRGSRGLGLVRGEPGNTVQPRPHRVEVGRPGRPARSDPAAAAARYLEVNVRPPRASDGGGHGCALHRRRVDVDAALADAVSRGRRPDQPAGPHRLAGMQSLTASFAGPPEESRQGHQSLSASGVF